MAYQTLLSVKPAFFALCRLLGNRSTELHEDLTPNVSFLTLVCDVAVMAPAAPSRPRRRGWLVCVFAVEHCGAAGVRDLHVSAPCRPVRC